MNPLDLMSDYLPCFLLILLIGIGLGWAACKWMYRTPPQPTWEQRQFLNHN